MAKKVRAAGKALDTLVSQFAQPLACLRELVQNAIDARTNRVDVSLRHSQADQCYILSVADTGEGMTREIIESQLTRLFASNKENDLTKVGKFGIGFVSVFALNPQAVVVDTGRDGESWRVLFGPDRTFQLISSEDKFEGTSVTLYLPQNRHKLNVLEKEVRDTLAFWCRHCRTEINLNGQSISESFSVKSPFFHLYEETGTRLVLAAVPSARADFGYYNQGLTLLEGDEGPIPHLTFKLDSRYFEHTLTRDNLVENEDFHKAQKILRREALEVYPKKLFEKLREAPQPELWPILGHIHRLGIHWEKEPLFKDLWGQFHSLESLQKGHLYYHEQIDALAEAVHQPKLGQWVFPPRDGQKEFLHQQGLNPRPLIQEWGLSFAAESAEWEPLWNRVVKLAKLVTPRHLQLVNWFGSQEQLPFLWTGALGAVRWSNLAGPKDPILVNQQDALLAKLLRLASWNQALAAQVLVQHLLLLEADSKRQELALKVTEMSLQGP
jgi:hypothetical protein